MHHASTARNLRLILTGQDLFEIRLLVMACDFTPLLLVVSRLFAERLLAVTEDGCLRVGRLDADLRGVSAALGGGPAVECAVGGGGSGITAAVSGPVNPHLSDIRCPMDPRTVLRLRLRGV